MSVLLFTVCVLSIISFLYCFVFVDRNGKGVQAKMKRFLYETIPGSIKTCLRATLGERVVWWVERSVSYVCYEANPMI